MTPTIHGDAIARLNVGAAASARIDPVGAHVGNGFRVEHFRLGNGLQVLVWEDATAPVFAFQSWVKVGSRHDPVGRSGMAHLFEHLMFKATVSRPEGTYDRLMEARGGQNNAATWVDWTYYRAKLPRWELDFVCELEADRIVNLALAADMLEREREVVVNERLMRVDNDPDGKLYEAIYRTAFGDHPYGVPTIGWMEDIRAITLADCLDFYRTYYAPNNVTLVVVGDVATADVLARVQAHYGSFAHQAIPAEAARPLPPTEGGPRRLELTLPLATARMVVAWPAVPAGTPDHAALELAASILSDGESSRLHRALVEEHELALDVSSWVASCHDAGLFEVSMALRPGVDPARAEAVLHEALAAFLAGPLTPRELMKAQNGLEAGFLKGQADAGTRARQLGHALVATGRWNEVFEEQALLRETTADDILRVARTIMTPERQTIAWALPAAPAPDEDGEGDESEDDAPEGESGEAT